MSKRKKKILDKERKSLPCMDNNDIVNQSFRFIQVKDECMHFYGGQHYNEDS